MSKSKEYYLTCLPFPEDLSSDIIILLTERAEEQQRLWQELMNEEGRVHELQINTEKHDSEYSEFPFFETDGKSFNT